MNEQIKSVEKKENNLVQPLEHLFREKRSPRRTTTSTPTSTLVVGGRPTRKTGPTVRQASGLITKEGYASSLLISGSNHFYLLFLTLGKKIHKTLITNSLRVQKN